MLNVILSDNFLDANNAQIDLIGNGLRAHKKQIVLVPDKQVRSQEKRIMNRLKLGATFDLKVMSFSMLADKLLEGKKTCEMLSRFDAILVIEQLISTHKSMFKCFDKTLITISFAKSVYSVIAQFESCGISPNDLRGVLPKLESESLYKKLSDLLIIFDAYVSFKSNKFYDSVDMLKMLSDEILRGDFSQSDFHFCNFESMSKVEFCVLSNAIKVASSVSVGVMASEQSQPNGDLISSDILGGINDFCDISGIKPNFLRANSERADFVHHMLHNALAVVPQKMETTGAVEIYEASNPRLEVEFVALDIMQRVRGGARFRDFEINCANMQAYEPIIRNTFARLGIPFWIDSPTELEATEMGKFVLSAVDFAYDGMQAKDLYRFIGNSLSNFTQSERELFESVTTCYGITGAGLIEPPRLKNTDANYDKYLQLNQKLIPLFEFCRVTQSRATIVEYTKALVVLLEKYEVSQNLNGLAQALREDGLLKQSGVARQNYKKFEQILTKMSNFGDFKCDFSEFCKILKTGVSAVTINSQPESVDCVRVGQSGTSVFEEVKFYYILCAIEGNLPAYTNDVGLITDNDIESLQKIGIRFRPSVREENSLRRQSVINSLSYPTERICITYPISIDKDDCSVASVATSIMNMFTYKNAKLNAININSYWDIDFNFAGKEQIISQKYANIDEVLNGYIAGLTPVTLSADRQALHNSLYEVLLKFAPKMLKKVEKWRKKPQKVSNLQNPSAVFFTEDKAGVTQIEKFFECPYAHFLSYGLKIKENKTATMQATDIGTLLHAVLEAFGRKLAKDGVLDMAEIPKFVYPVFDKLLSRPDFENFTLNEANLVQLASLRFEAVRACEAINYQLQHSKYKIKFVESKFGTDDFVPIPEVAIINTNKSVKISGKIDRADVCERKLRIIDYKTSKNSAEFKLLNLYLGRKIQLFYYMAIMLKTLPYQPSGAYYLPIHKEYTQEEVLSPYSSFCMQGISLNNSADLLFQDDQLSFEHPKSDISGVTISTSKDARKLSEFKLKSCGASEEQFLSMLKYAEDVLNGAVQDIYSGYIEPSPLKDSCEFCKFKNICRIGVFVEDKMRTHKFDVEKTAVFATKGKDKEK